MPWDEKVLDLECWTPGMPLLFSAASKSSIYYNLEHWIFPFAENGCTRQTWDLFQQEYLFYARDLDKRSPTVTFSLILLLFWDCH
ncbi:hypothetical protein BDW71DRAFT_183920 [Aspergillus fruticulosus]